MLNQHALGLYEKALPPELGWMERLETAKSLGFDFMEISIDETDERLSRLDWCRSEKSALRDAIWETDIPLRSMCLSGHRRFPFGSEDPSARRRAREILQKALDFSSDLGIRTIQLAGYDVYYEPSTSKSRQLFLEGLQWAVKEAERYQIMLSMEIMDTPFLNSITKNELYRRQMHSLWYGVYPDLGNLTAWNNDVEAELYLGSGSIAAVHLKDTVAVTKETPGRFKGVPFGAGCVDFIHCFRVLEETGYTGPYLMEMWYRRGSDEQSEIRQARSFIEEQFSKAMRLREEDAV